MNNSVESTNKKKQFYQGLLRSFLTFLVVLTLALLYYFLNKSDSNSESSASSVIENSQTSTPNSSDFFASYNHSHFFPAQDVESFINTTFSEHDFIIPTLNDASGYYYRNDGSTFQVLALFPSSDGVNSAINVYEGLLISSYNKVQVISVGPYEALYMSLDERMAIYVSDFDLLNGFDIVKIDFQVV